MLDPITLATRPNAIEAADTPAQSKIGPAAMGSPARVAASASRTINATAKKGTTVASVPSA